jgi:hypothetical protein
MAFNTDELEKSIESKFTNDRDKYQWNLAGSRSMMVLLLELESAIKLNHDDNMGSASIPNLLNQYGQISNYLAGEWANFGNRGRPFHDTAKAYEERIADFAARLNH